MHKIRGKANVDHNIYILFMRPRLGAATLLILPTGKWLLPTRKQLFVCVTDFPKMTLPRGNFHGYINPNKRITHDSSALT